jgi:hypothetical protein
VFFLSFVLLSGAAIAQPAPLWLPPGVSSSVIDGFLDFTTNPQLQALTSHPRPIFACGVHKLPSDASGQWTLTFTLRGLRGYGNPGYSGFVMARWTPGTTPSLVLTNHADAVNGLFVDYNLELDPSGRFAAFDRFDTPANGLKFLGVFLASRQDDRSAFGAPVPVANVQGTNGFADPALGYVNGKLKLFYAGKARNSANVEVEGILMDDLLGAGTSQPQAAGNPVLVAQPVDRGGQPSRSCHSPSPVTGGDGDVEGLFLAEGDSAAGISEIYFAADLDPDTPHALTESSQTWLSSGGYGGGMALFTERANPQAPRRIQGAWLVGDVVSVGGTADVTMSAYSPPGGSPAKAIVFGGRWLPRPVQRPGVIGVLGVTPIPLFAGSMADADQVRTFRWRIPGFRWLRGVDIPIQGLAIHSDQGGCVHTMTNTATIRIR